MGMDMKAFREQFAERAQKDVKTQLVLEKISKAENITSDDEAVNEEINRMAENYKQSADEFKKHLREEDIEYIKNNLIITKTIKLLVDSAKIQ
jgi:trigger factor